MKKLLWLASLLLAGCGSAPIPEIPLQPIPESCPNYIDPNPLAERCTALEQDICRFDNHWTISGNVTDTGFRCVNGVWFQVNLYNEGSIKKPVWE